MDEVVQTTETVAEEVLDGGNLPSALEENKTSLDGFKIDEEFIAKNFKNGKLNGRFESIDSVLTALHDMETKYSNVMRDIKGGKYEAVDTEAVTKQQSQQKYMEVVQSILPEFIEKGMVVTPEMEAKAVEAGIDVRDLKLDAIEYKERVLKAYDIVGGEAEYKAMIQWGKDNLTEAQQRDFDLALNGSMSNYAIKGLYAEYRANANNELDVKADRVRGESSNSSSVRPYTTQQEMFKDRAYINGAGRNDDAAIALHRKRMALTDDKIVFGR